MITRQEEHGTERRTKKRFPLVRELRYKLLEDDKMVGSGIGLTVNMASGGIAFQIDHPLKLGTFVELSISWPVQLEDGCGMRLIVFGRIVRNWGKTSACRVEKYEFRTQARNFQKVVAVRNDAMLQRWAGGLRKEEVKLGLKAAGF